MKFPSFLLSAIAFEMAAIAAEGLSITGLSSNNGSAKAAVDQLQPNAAFQQSLEYVLPQLIHGGEWSSVIRLTNRSTTTIPTTNVFLVDNAGSPMRTTFQTSTGNTITDSGFAFSLPPGAMLEATFLGGRDTAFGHAFVGLCSAAGTCVTGLYAEVVLRNKNATRPDFESLFPIEQPSSFQYMLWDHRAGFSTVLYLVNNSTSTATVNLEFTNTSNQLIRAVPISMTSLSSQILTLHAIAPETIGQHGTLAIRAAVNTTSFTATALRVNPTNSFTPMRSFIPKL